MEPKANFWSNPENNSLKVIILVVVVVISGYFVFSFMQKNSLGGKGQVIDTSTSQVGGFTFKTDFTGNTCTTTVCQGGGQCVVLSGTDNKGGSCKLDDKQPTPEAQGLLPIITAQPVAQTN